MNNILSAITSLLTTQASIVRVSIIDVGKGDCILVQAGNSAVLIDTGYKKTAADALAHMREQGVDRLDAMIITHYDRDHVDGMSKIGAGIDIDAVYLPGYEGSDDNYDSCVASAAGIDAPTRHVTKKLVIPLGEARLTVYPPCVAYVPANGYEEGNDNDVSLVATLINGHDSFLFAGDLEQEGIDAFLATEAGRRHYDVLKMPHHGQHESNTADLLDTVRPKIAVITDSYKDPASKKTLKLLDKADAETYCTSYDGTVVIESNGTGSYQVRTEAE
jgi:beta-lactamase superfamily II metal-dependent hydrolase